MELASVSNVVMCYYIRERRMRRCGGGDYVVERVCVSGSSKYSLVEMLPPPLSLSVERVGRLKSSHNVTRMLFLYLFTSLKIYAIGYELYVYLSHREEPFSSTLMYGMDGAGVYCI